MAFSGSYNALKRLTSSAISAILDTPQRPPSLAVYTKYNLPVRFRYKRPDFLDLDEEATAASADHEIRPIMRPKRPLAMDAGYAEAINAGKTIKINEDQSVVHTFNITVPPDRREEHWTTEQFQIPCVYFAIFDGHAGIGSVLTAAHCCHEHVKQKLTDISHMLVLSDEEILEHYLQLGIIQSVTVEKLIMGALEEAFWAMDEQIRSERYDYRLDGGCTALVALFMKGKLFVANAGDCRAVLYKDFVPKQMSRDHCPESERQRIQWLAYHNPHLLGDEFTRLQFQHRPRRKHIGTKQLYRDKHMNGWGLKTIDKNDLKPQLVSGEGKRARLLDTIGTTRGFGDHDLEVPYNLGLKIKPFMSCQPEVEVYDLEQDTFTDNDVLVMASDGLWEKFSNEDVQHILEEKLLSQCDARRYIVAAQALVDEVKGTMSERGWRSRNGELGSYDDVSVFVIPLKKYRDFLHTSRLHKPCREPSVTSWDKVSIPSNDPPVSSNYEAPVVSSESDARLQGAAKASVEPASEATEEKEEVNSAD